jgi:hypothetical protein
MHARARACRRVLEQGRRLRPAARAAGCSFAPSLACPAGSQPSACAAGGCLACAAGAASPGGAAACANCTAGSASPGGAAACSACPAGQTSAAGGPCSTCNALLPNGDFALGAAGLSAITCGAARRRPCRGL